MNGLDIVNEARMWLGTPFAHRGRDRNGVDCAGLVIAIARELELDKVCGFTDAKHYPRYPSDDSMRVLLRRFMRQVRDNELQAGDVLHFTFGLLPQHAAIYTGADNKIIHAYNSGRKVVIQTSYTGKWPARLQGVYRFRGLA